MDIIEFIRIYKEILCASTIDIKNISNVINIRVDLRMGFVATI